MPYKDPEVAKAYARAHYQKNKGLYVKRSRERNNRVRDHLKKVLDRYKVMKGCVDCGYKAHPEALHFDHKDYGKDKKHSVAYLRRTAASMKKIKEQVFACEVRCANCHMIRTAQQRKTHWGK